MPARAIIALSLVLIVLLPVHGLAATAPVPCLLAGGVSFIPIAVLPDKMHHIARQSTPRISIEGLEFTPVRSLASAFGASVEWSSRSRTIRLDWPQGSLQLQALVGPRFWQNPTIHRITGRIPRTIVTKCGRIVDGDTIVLANGDRLRYIGIDTPETKHPQKPVEFFGREASAFNHGLVADKTITVEFDISQRDRYGRLLGYVYVGDIFVNAELIAQGYARTLTYPPDVRYAELFSYLQTAAREARRGLWADEKTGTADVPASARKYIGSRNSNVYHLPHCRFVAQINEANAIWFATPSAAKAAGYRPCRGCNPPDR